MRRLLEVRTGRHPYEVAVLVGTVAVGVAGVFLDVSNAVVATMGYGLSKFFYGGLALFALITLAGIFKRKRIEGMLVERIGCCVMALYYLVFAICVVSDRGTGGLATTILVGGLSVAAGVRAHQIRIDLQKLKSYLAENPFDTDLNGR